MLSRVAIALLLASCAGYQSIAFLGRPNAATSSACRVAPFSIACQETATSEKVITCSERACARYIWLPSSSEANENPLFKVCTLNQALIRELAQDEDVYYGSDNRVQVELTTLLSIKNLRITWQHAEQELREHKNVLLRLSSKQHVNPAMTLDEAKMLKQSEKLVEILEIHQKNPDVFQVISHLCLSTFLYLMDARVLY